MQPLRLPVPEGGLEKPMRLGMTIARVRAMSPPIRAQARSALAVAGASSALRPAGHALGLLLALAACGKGDASGGGGAPSPPSAPELRSNIGIDLTQVTGFVITRAGTALSSGPYPHPQDAPVDAGAAATEMYAMDAEGNLTVVTVTDGPDGGSSTASTAVPAAAFATSAYVLFAYSGVTHEGAICNFVAARKADGALYCISETAAVSPDGAVVRQELGLYWRMVQSDAAGSTVWIDHAGTVTRLDLADPDHLTQSVQLAPTEPGAHYAQAVNADGDDLVARVGGATGFARVLLRGSGFFSASDEHAYCVVSGPPSEPNAFYFTENGPPALIKLAKVSAQSFEKSTVTALDGPVFCERGGLAKAGEHIFLTDLNGPGPTELRNQILDLSGGAPIARTVDALDRIDHVAACEPELFILGTDTNGNGGIVRYDIADEAFLTLLPPGEYAIDQLSVSPACEVTFYGQRASDGAFILGNIGAGTTQVTVVATGFPTVTQIERIQ